MPVYPNVVPTVQVLPAAEPVHHAAPKEVFQYLKNRGWNMTYGNLWVNDAETLIGYDFQWPEALAYEIFQNFVMLKTPGE